MNQLEYLDFDVLFEKSGEEYTVRVLNSPTGQASSRFGLPFSPYEVENLLLRIGKTRRGVRRLESPEMEASRTFGSRLFSAVFDDEVLACLRSSLNASYRKGMGLRLRLRLSQAPELLDLPWEFLFDPTRNQFLVLSVDTPLVRYLDLPQDVQPLTITPPLNVLAMIASPTDYPPLDVAREWEKLNEALGDLKTRNLVSLTRLETANLANLQRALRRGQYHVFHFIGHGGFDAQAQDGVLLTEDENGRGRPVSGYDLGTLLHDHRSLRLAVLNACEGARSSLTDPFAGTAQSLVQNGIPAVIAMQFEITDQAAILLAHEFYGALADGYPVDASLAEARKAIFAQGNDVEWATPVLYLRAPDAAIFQIEAVAKPAAPPAGKPAIEEPPVEKPVGEKLPGGVPLAAAAIRPGELQAGEKTLRQASQEKAEVSRLYTQGLSAFWLDEWGQAIQSLEAVLKLQPDHVEAASRLETARRNLELDRLYREAQAAEVAGDWAAASAALEQLTGLSPSYQDAQARLAAARLQCQLVDLFAEARQLSQAGEWQAVVKIYDRIAELDPGAPDPDGLLANAQEQLAAQKKQAELEALYDRAVIALDAGRWEEAAGLLRQVLERQPGYAQSERLLARAEVELERQEAPIEIETIVAASAVPAAVAIADSTPVATVAVDTPEETLAPPAQEEAAAGPAGEWQAAARRAVRPALWMAAGWLLAGLAAIWLVGFSDRVSLIETLHTLYPGTTHEKIGYLLFILVSGPLSGLAVGIVLHRTALRLTKRQFLGLAAAWTVVGLLPAPFFIQGEITTAYIFTWFLAGALGGWATYAVLQRAGARLDRQARWAIILGWAIGLGIGTLLFRENSETIILLAFAVEGFIGGLATFTAWYRDGETKTRQVGTGPTLEAPVVEAETESPAPAPVATQIVGEPGASQTTEMIAGLPRAIRPALWLAAGWFLASLAALFFVYYTDLGGSLADWIYKSNIIDWNDAHYIPTVLVAGLLSGAAVGTVLGMAGLRPSRRQFLVLMGAWGLAYLFTALFIFGDFGRSVIVFSWFLAGALGGWVTYAVMRRAGARFDRQATLVIVLGWAVGLAFKEWLVEAIYFGTIYGLLEAANLSTFADNIGIPLFISLGHAVAGFIGGLATFAVWFSLEKAND